MSDVSSSLLPAGAVFNATNILFDNAGVARRRGKVSSPTGSTVTASLVQIGAFQSGTLENSMAVYGLPATAASVGLKINSINTGSGAFTAMVAQIAAHNATIFSGRPFKHFANLIFPQRNVNGAAYDGFVAAGGATTTKANKSGSAATISAGSDSITGLTGISGTGDMELGGYLYLTDGSSPKNVYLGRVTELTSASAVKVEPPPTRSFTATAAAFSTTWAPTTGAGAGVTRSGSVGCSFQNRILLANTNDWGVGVPGIHPTRVIYTVLPNEVSSIDGSTQTVDGYRQLMRSAFEDNNFFEIPSSNPITAIAPIGEGDLIIFTASECFRGTGYLATQNTSTEPGAQTFDVRKISSTIGCISEQTMRQTPRGLVFAAKDGVYAYDGAQFHPLMQGKIQNFIRDRIQNSSQPLQGSALLRQNHYMLTGSNGGYGYLVNLDTLAWSLILNSGQNCPQVWDAVVDPTDATGNTVWGIRWYNTASPPGMIGGQLVRLDTLLDTTTTQNSYGSDTDCDGSAIVGSLDTGYFSETDQETLKNFRRVQVEYQSSVSDFTLKRGVIQPEASVAPTTLLTLPHFASDARRQVTGIYSTVKSMGVWYRVLFNGPGELYTIKHSFSPTRVGRSQ
jgi:hypothetical protein